MSPTQIKIALYAGLALVAWLLTREQKKAPGTVTTYTDIEANVYNPNFGMTDAQIAARGGNPALDLRMRELIDVSNSLIAAEDLETQ